ncbi:MAG: ThiF family adenylyltransferase [Holosporales bacterium]
MQRYQRQMILPELGEQGQRRLSASRAVVIGAGGLGCPALQYLTGAGVGHITLVDDDVVSLSNLHRQVLYTDADIGTPKVHAAAARLRAMNPTVAIHPVAASFTAANAAELINGADVVLDCTDTFAAKFLAADAAVKYGVPLVYGAILGWNGEAALFDSRNGACFRCLYTAPPLGHVPNCAEAGVIGALAGVIGSVQALEAIKVLLGLGTPGVLLQYDGLTATTRRLSVTKDPACPTCSHGSEDIMFNTAVSTITAAAAAALPDALYLDVREPYEWQAGHVRGAVHLPLGQIASNPRDAAATLPPGKNIVIYCKAGVRSAQAAVLLQAQGATNLHSLTGGIDAWTAAHGAESLARP